MSKPVYCSTFVIDRFYPVAPRRVFAAWASVEAKRRWFCGPDGWPEIERVFDVRPGGREHAPVYDRARRFSTRRKGRAGSGARHGWLLDKLAATLSHPDIAP